MATHLRSNITKKRDKDHVKEKLVEKKSIKNLDKEESNNENYVKKKSIKKLDKEESDDENHVKEKLVKKKPVKKLDKEKSDDESVICKADCEDNECIRHVHNGKKYCGYHINAYTERDKLEKQGIKTKRCNMGMHFDNIDNFITKTGQKSEKCSDCLEKKRIKQRIKDTKRKDDPKYIEQKNALNKKNKYWKKYEDKKKEEDIDAWNEKQRERVQRYRDKKKMNK